MPINSFVDESTYDSHTKSSVDSEVSLIENTNEIKYDGINVEVKYPKFGDALYVENTGDANNLTKHFIDGKSLDTSLLPNSWIPVGVVFENKKGTVYIHHYKGYNNGDNTIKWASAWLYDIDVIVDGTERSITFIQPTSGNPITVGTFTHSCSTQEQFAQELDTWLRANQGGIAAGGDWDYNWHCEYMENYEGVMKPIVIIDNMVSYRQYVNNGIVSRGATAKANMLNMISFISDIVGYKRNNGGSGIRTGTNYKRMLAYWTNNTTISNPSSMVSIKDNSNVVSKDQFDNNQYCADLRTEYGTYEKYIESLMLLYPTLYRGVGKEHNNSKVWNFALCNKTHKKKDGTLISTFPSFNYASSINVNSYGLTADNWYVPNCEELYWLLSKVTYGLSGITTSNCDQFNKTLNKMGGNLVSCIHPRWSCCARSNNRSWTYYYHGYFANDLLTFSYRVSCISALQVTGA